MIHIPKIEMFAARKIVELIAVESISPSCRQSQEKETNAERYGIVIRSRRNSRIVMMFISLTQDRWYGLIAGYEKNPSCSQALRLCEK